MAPSAIGKEPPINAVVDAHMLADGSRVDDADAILRHLADRRRDELRLDGRGGLVPTTPSWSSRRIAESVITLSSLTMGTVNASPTFLRQASKSTRTGFSAMDRLYSASSR